MNQDESTQHQMLHQGQAALTSALDLNKIKSQPWYQQQIHYSLTGKNTRLKFIKCVSIIQTFSVAVVLLDSLFVPVADISPEEALYG